MSKHQQVQMLEVSILASIAWNADIKPRPLPSSPISIRLLVERFPTTNRFGLPCCPLLQVNMRSCADSRMVKHRSDRLLVPSQHLSRHHLLRTQLSSVRSRRSRTGSPARGPTRPPRQSASPMCHNLLLCLLDQIPWASDRTVTTFELSAWKRTGSRHRYHRQVSVQVHLTASGSCLTCPAFISTQDLCLLGSHPYLTGVCR